MEQESRISQNDVPEKAKAFMAKIGFNGKTKWFYEKGENHSTIEGKTKVNKQLYSVEFDSTGLIQDIEVSITFNEIPAVVRTSIDSCLSDHFSSHTIRKTQRQYTGSFEQLSSFKANKPSKDLTVKYEIIVSGKKNGELQWYECTFDDNGLIESSRKVVFSNSDNLEY